MSPDTDVAAIVEELTLAEAIELTVGTSDPTARATGYLAGVPRLDVPPIRLVDGPLGVRIPGETSTAFPAPLAVSAAFDADLAREHGAALGRETRGKDQDVLLAPGLNVIRVPHNGRNFEYYSEDPVLTASTAAAVVEGIQSQDVVATPKHYVANNQETDRAALDVDVGERALRELYLAPFRATVDAGAGAVMSSYNGLDGTPMSEHRRLLTDVLKEEWGFSGFVVSDWFATREAAPAATGGMDVEMPGVSMLELLSGGEQGGEDEGGDGGFSPADIDFPEEFASGMPDPESVEGFREALPGAVERGEVPRKRVFDMAQRVLTAAEDVGVFDDDRADGAVDTEAHRELARRVAIRGSVLLENDGVLPLDEADDVALIGPNVDEAVLGGGGSSETTPVVETSPIEGIEERAAGSVTVAHGLPPVEGFSMFDFGDDEGEEGEDGHGSEPGEEYSVDDAAAAAADADVAVVVVRDVASEATDREDLRLPDRQDELIEAVAAANDRTVVALNTSGPIEVPWREDVAAVLEQWYPGQAHGHALAAVLYGDEDPGGRLPVTFAPEGTYPTDGDERRFPGVEGTVHYEEGVFVGYRHFDATDATPTYPFGHGESYADVAYRDAAIDGDAVTVDVANVGDRDGREVVQVYVRPQAVEGVDRPVREFAGAASVGIEAGEVASVRVPIDDLALQRYDPADGWTVDPGEYTVEVARSAGDVRAELSLER